MLAFIFHGIFSSNRVSDLIHQYGKIIRGLGRFLGIAKVVFFLVILSIFFPAVLQAQPEEEGPNCPGWQAFSVSASPVFQLGSTINGGGSLSVNSYYFNAAVQRQINEKFGIGLSLLYNLHDYRFSGVTAIPLADPWDTVLRYGLAIPLTFSLAEQWRLIFVPIAQFSGETGAQWSNALVYGGVASANYNFGKGSYIGLGLAAFSNIAETDVFPFIDINWHITDRWRLSNPLESSPSGPGGLKLSYGLTPHWEVGIAAAYRFNRFRLDKNGPLPNGVGQYSQMPVVANVTYTYSLLTLSVYGGVSFNNNIWLENSNGDGIYRADQHPAPLVGMSLTLGVEPTQFRMQPWQIREFRNIF